MQLFHQLHIQRVGSLQKASQLVGPAAVLLGRPDVGVVVQHRHLKMGAQHLQHRAGAGPAAGVKQQGRALVAQGGEHLIHLGGIIGFVGHEKHLIKTQAAGPAACRNLAERENAPQSFYHDLFSNGSKLPHKFAICFRYYTITANEAACQRRKAV